MRLLLLDVAVGLLLLAAIGVAALRKRHRRSTRARACGWVLVAIPMPAAVVAHLMLRLPPGVDQSLFLAGAAAFAIGAALVLGGEEEDWREEREDEAPPWWPAFEREFREYELRQSHRPRILR